MGVDTTGALGAEAPTIFSGSVLWYYTLYYIYIYIYIYIYMHGKNCWDLDQDIRYDGYIAKNAPKLILLQ